MVWFAVCSKEVSPVVIFDEGTIDHARYIREVLPVALKYGNDIVGTYWTFQQDGAMPHVHHLTQQWCKDNFPSFIDKDHWPPNSPDLNPLDYSIWDELLIGIRSRRKILSSSRWNERLERFVNKLSLKVVRLGLIDCLTYPKMMEIIFDNKNNVFCRAFNGEYFEKKFNSLG